MRSDAGGFFVLETRNTEWTWRPLNLTRRLSAMEVCGIWHIYLRIFLFNFLHCCILLHTSWLVYIHSIYKWMRKEFWYWNINFNAWLFNAGYYGDGLNAIIVFAVCFMPESNQPNYRYIMENLFKWVIIWTSQGLWSWKFITTTNGFFCCRYVIGTLELLVAENYMIVYLNGATSRKKMPTVGWLRKCYQQIDRRWI